MLEELLAEIRSGGTIEVGKLAAVLGTTPELVGAMLDHLQRLGYVQAYHSCSDACSGCSLSKECRPAQAGIQGKKLFMDLVPRHQQKR